MSLSTRYSTATINRYKLTLPDELESERFLYPRIMLRSGWRSCSFFPFRLPSSSLGDFGFTFYLCRLLNAHFGDAVAL